ncbi:MAG: TRAP transporter substrate-binding protein DctP, partial [Alphaproteobacteria bacterium]
MDFLSRRAMLLGAASLPLAAPFISKAVAQTRWQLATAYPDGNFHTRNLRDFITEVQGAAGGLQIQMHSNASLLRMPEIKRGV